MEPKLTKGMRSLGVANIVLACLGFCAWEILVFGSVTVWTLAPDRGQRDVVDTIASWDWRAWYWLGATLVSPALDLLLQFAGLWILRLDRRARWAMKVWCCAILALLVADVAMAGSHAGMLGLLVACPLMVLNSAYVVAALLAFGRPAWRSAFAA